MRNVQSQFRLKAHPTHSPNFDMCLACIPQRNSSFFFYKITFHVIALNQNHNLHLINLQKVYTICFTAAAGTILTTIYLLVKAHKNAGEAYIAFLHQAEVSRLHATRNRDRHQTSRQVLCGNVTFSITSHFLDVFSFFVIAHDLCNFQKLNLEKMCVSLVAPHAHPQIHTFWPLFLANITLGFHFAGSRPTY